MKLSDKKATLSFSDGSPSVDFPMYDGSVGPQVIDIRKLYGQTGLFTYDPGFLSTASCTSNITYIDGDKGELLYRGYPIEELAVNCDFMDVSYLILNGELPDPKQRTDFDYLVTHHTMVNEQIQFFLRGFRRASHARRGDGRRRCLSRLLSTWCGQCRDGFKHGHKTIDFGASQPRA